MLPMTSQQALTVCDAFAATATARADEPALASADGSIRWTWGEYAERAEAAAAALAAAGVTRGDTVALWLANRPEFHVVDTGATLLGAAPFSVYATFTAEQAEHVIGDAGSRILITEPQFLDRALAVLARGGTALELVVLVEGEHEQATAWADLLAGASPAFDVRAAARAVQPEDLVTLIYTSGTTGPPKGVELTHANVVAQSAALAGGLELQDGLRAISWLPMAHVAERMCTHYVAIALGWSVTCLPDPRQIAAALTQVRPQFFFSPPRLWEKLRAAITATLGDLSDPATALTAVGLDEARIAAVGAAPCPAEVVRFWTGLGLPLCEVYGMSETTGVATVNRPSAVRIGTVGTPVQDVEVTLSPEGEVLMRGPVVMRGYRNLPEKTAEAIDADGWLHSGDVGVFDDDGHLRIVDRIKELIINAAGKNMSPANIEATVKTACPLAGNVCCIGDARPYNVALVTLDPDALAAFAAAGGLADVPPAQLAIDERVHAAVAAGIDRANEALARVEQIKRFAILGADWAPGGTELTPTMKLKRKAIASTYAGEIEALYA